MQKQMQYVYVLSALVFLSLLLIYGKSSNDSWSSMTDEEFAEYYVGHLKERARACPQCPRKGHVVPAKGLDI